MRNELNVSCALVAGLVGGCIGDGSDESSLESALRGAIFTTLEDGSRVNNNIYDDKDDVYLDGGPGDQAPQGAAALDDGLYCFQVTDPSGRTLLSQDPVSCRQFTIEDGVIVAVGSGACAHDTGVDQDHDALTVQLMPYADTPNNGGEYKVWISLCEDVMPGEGRHGFIPRYSKTDNFKVRDVEEPPPPPPPYCGDGVVNDGEECDDGNNDNGDGCSATCELEVPPPPPPCCGDGVVDAGEECDDGNTSDGDGCSATCQLEEPPPPPCCGDGVVDAGEECDDGNTSDGDGCSATCQLEEVVCPVVH